MSRTPGAVLEFHAKRAAPLGGVGVNPLATWKDLSGHGHDGALYGFDWTASSGWVGAGTDADPHALRFDAASGDYLRSAPIELAGMGETFECWVRPTTIAGDYTYRILACHQNYGNTGWVLYDTGQGTGNLHPCLHKGGGLWAAEWVESFVLSLNTLTHVALVMDNAALTATLYVDGVSRGPRAMTGPMPLPTGEVLAIADAGTPYSTRLAAAALYDRPLTATEVAANFAAGLYLPDPLPSAKAWTFDALATAPRQRIAVKAEAYIGATKVADLSVAGGSVTADARRAILRDCSLELSPTDRHTLTDLFEILVTPGCELTVSRGFVLPDGAELLAPLGRFVPSEPQWKRAATGETLSVAGNDLSVKIQRARWADPYLIAAGTGLAAALAALLEDRYVRVAHNLSADVMPETIGAQVVTEAGESSDPWQDALAIAGAYGYALYPDPAGVFTARLMSLPTAGGQVFTFERGAAAIVTEYNRSSPLERLYNGVIATGEGSDLDVPVRGEAWDENPASPTYRHGPFGQVPYYYSSPLLTTADECETAARKILSGVTGRVEQLSWSAAVHPGLQPLDVVAVEQADGSLAYYILDALTIPLGASETMPATAREVTV